MNISSNLISFLFLLIYGVSTSAEPSCAQLLSGVDTQTRRSEKVSQTRNRGQNRYFDAFRLKPFFEEEVLRKKGLYIDSGAGKGKMLSNIASWVRPADRGPLVGIELRPFSKDLESRLQKGKDALYEGRIEELDLSHMFGQASLITDYYGPFAYSDNIGLILNLYWSLLKPGGRAYIMLGTKGADRENHSEYSKVFDGKGNQMSLIEWLKVNLSPVASIQQAQLDGWNESVYLVLEKPLNPINLHLPNLECLASLVGAPPIRHFLSTNAKGMSTAFKAPTPPPVKMNLFEFFSIASDQHKQEFKTLKTDVAKPRKLLSSLSRVLEEDGTWAQILPGLSFPMIDIQKATRRGLPSIKSDYGLAEQIDFEKFEITKSQLSKDVVSVTEIERLRGKQVNMISDIFGPFREDASVLVTYLESLKPGGILVLGAYRWDLDIKILSAGQELDLKEWLLKKGYKIWTGRAAGKQSELSGLILERGQKSTPPKRLRYLGTRNDHKTYLEEE